MKMMKKRETAKAEIFICADGAFVIEMDRRGSLAHLKIRKRTKKNSSLFFLSSFFSLFFLFSTQLLKATKGCASCSTLRKRSFSLSNLSLSLSLSLSLQSVYIYLLRRRARQREFFYK